MPTKLYIICISIFILGSCQNKAKTGQIQNDKNEPIVVPVIDKLETKDVSIVVGAAQLETYLPYLQGKKVGITVNHTSFIDDKHIVDALVEQQIDVQQIFAPEHGFRGQADAGATVSNGKDGKTGIPILSLYGKRKKPLPEDLNGLDIVIFDIQDVGARFYTYISTMHYVMEACAENNIPVLILDRPNPNGHYIDGPVLEEKYKSFVGMHPIPVVHGLTVGELAKMINGEGWLKNGIQCDITIIPCLNYSHHSFYKLPIKPSPNLPNMKSIYLYPSLCFFEGTDVNVGRGTDKQFQVFGHPDFPNKDFSYKPTSRSGAKYPKHENKTCYGKDLSGKSIEDLQGMKQVNLNYILDYYKEFNSTPSFFLKNNFFEKLAGTASLRKDIKALKNEKDIRASWQAGIDAYKSKRKKYLLYTDFE